MLYKIYIGANNKTGQVEQKKAVALISSVFDGFTITKSSGYWKGKPERSVVIELETEDKHGVMSLIQKLREALKQDAIGLAVIGKLQFIT